ncbi:MAG TPA: hypothetical protein PKZ75_10010 [Bacteroidia bacterium]|nr:hypothetical protein [Bacteroidia bacterium]
MKHFFLSDTVKCLGIFVTTSILLASCKHKTNFEELTPVSYSSSIAPIINSNCAYSGCHGDSAFEKFSLVTYDGLMSGGITAGSPEKSKLYQTLKTLNEEEMMPKKPYSELSENQIQMIYVWIGQGAKNN